MKHLPLDRPLACFDLETTGTDIGEDRIVQIAVIRVEPDGAEQSFVSLVNPGRSIPAAASAVHGIQDDDVREAPSFAALWPRLAVLFDGADLAGFNILNFDLPLLQTEVERVGGDFHRADRRLVDAMRIFHLKEPRHLTAALHFYCGRELIGAHDALADTRAALDVLDAQLARYDDLPHDAAGLHELCNPGDRIFLDRNRKLRWNDAGQAVLTFGKQHKGRSLQELVGDPKGRDYLLWMAGADFAADVKAIVRAALEGRFPQPPLPALEQAPAATPPAAPAEPWTLFPGGDA